ncbi:ArsR family transcriptional regulator [Methanoregula sp.]|jgi:predicted transcriptional regulator|uniref:ArsR family transcriptional regulator n=1 Tax=Methanoregula sp. TaxID=2052170 RepID=UPI003C752E00
MKTKSVVYFTQKEEELVQLLVDIGIRKVTAKVLVFMADTPEATSREIERGTDLRQPEVSIAMNYLSEQGWMSSRKNKAAGKGRPLKIYRLAKSFAQIMQVIEKQKKEEAKNHLELVQKLRSYTPR